MKLFRTILFMSLILPLLLPVTARAGSMGSAPLVDTATPIPGPELLAPAVGSTPDVIRPVFRWADIPGAASYNIVVSSYSSFAFPVVDANVTVPTYTPSADLPRSATLYWRVRVTGPAVGPWASASFISPNPPFSPAPLSPGLDAAVTDDTPTLTWAESSIPSGTTFAFYQLQVDTENDFSSPLIDRQETDSLNRAYTFAAALAPSSTYYWRIRTANTLNQYSMWRTSSFRTSLPAPTLLSPALLEVPGTRRPTLDWSDVPGATGYGLEVSSHSDFSSPLISLAVADSIYIPTADLPRNTLLYWRVRTHGADISAWSTSSFTTPDLGDTTPSIASRTPTRTQTATQTLTPSKSPTPTGTMTPTPTPVPGTATPTPTVTPTLTFTPTPGSTPVHWLTVTAPNGGEVMTVGDVYRITWDSSPNIDRVFIGYQACPNCLDWIAVNTLNTGFYDWTVLVGYPGVTSFTIYVMGVETNIGSATDTSDAAFTVLTPATPTPTVTPTASRTRTATVTPTKTATRTITPTPSSTRTPTRTSTASVTRTVTKTPTSTTVRTATRTPTITRTFTPRPTRTPTRTLKPLPRPTLLAPAEGSLPDTIRPTFDWNDAPDAVAYNIVISRYSSFDFPVVNVNTGVSSYTPDTDLPRNVPLYWRVRVIRPYFSPWATASFQAPNPPFSPPPISPGLNALVTTYTPTLDWGPSVIPEGAVFGFYQLQVDDNNDFSSPFVDFMESDSLNSSYDFASPLAPNSTYYWRIRTVNTLNQHSLWRTSSFRTALLPPVLVSPLSPTVPDTLRPLFDWQDVPGATGYGLQVSLHSDFSSPLINLAVSTSLYQAVFDLPGNSVLYWRVRAHGNNMSAWSSSSFTSPNPPNTIVLISPLNQSLVPLRPTLNWEATTLPAGTQFAYYQLQLSINNEFNNPIFDTTLTDISQHSFTFTDENIINPNNTQYYWRVRAANTANQLSAWAASSFLLAPKTSTPTPTRTRTLTPTRTATPAPVVLGQLYQNNQYGFKFYYPDDATFNSDTGSSAQIHLSIVPGTNLAEKYIQITYGPDTGSCHSFAPGVTLSTTKVINAISFSYQEGQDRAAGNIFDWVSYSAVNEGVCVNMLFILHSGNPDNYFPTPPPLFDQTAESQVFGQMMQTFAWLTPAATLTPSLTPTLTPTPQAGSSLAYDFMANLCQAEWVTDVGLLSCPGLETDARAILQVDAPRLGDGSVSASPGLLALIQGAGYFLGRYPAYVVQPGDHFQTTVGCQYGMPNCISVTFRLDYITPDNTAGNIWYWTETAGNQVNQVDLDLTPLAGQSLRFVLVVMPTGTGNSSDRMLWVAPRIVHAGGNFPTATATLVPPTPTRTRTPTPTRTPTVTLTPGATMTITPMPTTGNWDAYRNSKYGFSMTYPVGQIVSSTDNSAYIDLPIQPGTNLVEKYLQINIYDSTSNCQLSSAQTIYRNGKAFLKQTSTDQGAGQIRDVATYAIVRGNVCITLMFVLHSGNPGNFSPPVPLFNKDAESSLFEDIMVVSFTWDRSIVTPTPVGAVFGPYTVWRVAPNDVLNIHSAAGASSPVVGTFPPDATNVMRTANAAPADGHTWVEVLRPGGGTGWVDLSYLTEYVTQTDFCATSLTYLLTGLKDALVQSDGDSLSAIISPRSGLDVRLWSNQPAVNFTAAQAGSIFQSSQVYDWGAGPGGINDIGTFAQIINPKLLDVVNNPGMQVTCDDTSRVSPAVNPWAQYYNGTHYYTLYKPGTPGVDLDYRTWLVGFEYTGHGVYLFALMHFANEP